MQYKFHNFFDYLFEHTSDLDKNFLLNPGQEISYRDLYNRCLKLADYLYSESGAQQNIVIICPNSLFFITVYLATIKSGNVIVPLNYEIEQRNLDYILQLTETNLVFTTTQYAKKLDFKEVTVLTESDLDSILVTRHSSLVTDPNTPTPTHQVSSIKHPVSLDSLAEIIFTSGSTGEPKGVMISHKNLMANTWSILEYLKLTSEDIMLVVLPFYYCYGLSLLHTHLRVGGSLALNNMFIMLGGVINDLKKYKCTGFAGVPSHFQILLRKSDSFKTTLFPDLKYVTQAGGKLHDVFIKEFVQVFPQIKFIVMYGQTEATARLTFLPPELLQKKIGSCGKAIPGVTIRVVDVGGKQVEAGDIGEIIACGDNIMKGYYKHTAQSCLKDSNLYTGDIGTIDQDGFVFLKARKKEIIKIRGKRISPKEIEEVFVELPYVLDCSVQEILDEKLGEAIKVILDVTNECNANVKMLKYWCHSRLASYKCPHFIEIRSGSNPSNTGKKLSTSENDY